MTDTAGTGPHHRDRGGWLRGVDGHDQDAWASAVTLEQLGDLVADWLQGHLGSRPGYVPARGPDPETTQLIPHLVTACRSGLVTTSSQPGLAHPEHHQRAALTGCCRRDLRDALVLAGSAHGLLVHSQHVPDLRAVPSTPITIREGRERTWVTLPTDPANALRHWSNAVLHPRARAELAQSWIVAVIDPEWGRRARLWTVLGSVLTAVRDQRRSSSGASSRTGR